MLQKVKPSLSLNREEGPITREEHFRLELRKKRLEKKKVDVNEDSIADLFR